MNRDDTIKAIKELRQRIDAVLQALDAGETPPVDARAGYNDYFSYTNSLHRTLANDAFKRLGISESSQSWFVNKRLHGVRLRDLAEVIESEHAAYLKRYPRNPYVRRQ